MINIPATHDSPAISIEDNPNIVKIIGSSYPENAIDVYSPLFDWIEEFEQKSNEKIRCEFYFNYLNSASRKILYELLLKLEMLNLSKNTVTVIWQYDQYDEDMYDFGEELADLIEIPFEMVSVEE